MEIKRLNTNDVNGGPSSAIPQGRSTSSGNGRNEAPGVVIMRNPRTTINIGQWNVRTMQRTGKLENVINEMKKLNISIMGLGETRWKGTGDQINEEGYRIIHSGGKKMERGVAIILDKRLANRIKNIVYKGDRILMVKIDYEPKDIVIIQVYMPTSQHRDEEIEEMYEEIEELMESAGGDFTVVMGDWNACIGEQPDGKEIGKYGLGTQNNRGRRLLEFCQQRKMCVTNTWFEHPKRRRYTWRTPGDRERYQLDYIMVQQRYRNSVKNSCSYPGADADTDHNLVMMKTNIKLKKIRKAKPKMKWNLTKLNNSRYKQELNKILEEEQRPTEDINAEWNKFRDDIKKAAETTIGYVKQKRAKKSWVTEEMLIKMEERRKWKSINSEEGRRKYRALNNELRRITDKARENWWQEQCEQIENQQRRGNHESMYAKIKKITSENKAPECNKIKDKNGILKTTPEEIRKRWKEYIEELYDAENKPSLNEIPLNQEEEGLDLLDSEIEDAIKSLKKKKSEGCDGIPAELIQEMEGIGMEKIKNICRKIYTSGKWPEDYSTTVMIPIKKKPMTQECNEHRTISLITHASKIILRIMLRRMEKRAYEYIGESQFGFKKNCGTREAIGLLRIIMDRYIDANKEVYACFIDFEKAFDRVDWKKLLEILENLGVDSKERSLIRNLYESQQVKIRIENKESEPAYIGRGVRQGCILSPILFSIYTETIMKEALEDIEEGVKIGGRQIKDIRFADDQVVLAETKEGIQRLMDALNNTIAKYNMKMNIKKTKSMRISRRGDEIINIQINGTGIEQVKTFKYLGAEITSDGKCQKEIQIRIAKAKNAFTKIKELLSKGLNIRTKKRIIASIVWSVFLYGSESWALRKQEFKKIDALEMWMWRRILKINWRDHVTNEEVRRLIGTRKSLRDTIIGRKKTWIGHTLRGNDLIRTAIEGQIEGARTRGRPRVNMLDEIIGNGTYLELKRRAENREQWRRWNP